MQFWYFGVSKNIHCGQFIRLKVKFVNLWEIQRRDVVDGVGTGIELFELGNFGVHQS